MSPQKIVKTKMLAYRKQNSTNNMVNTVLMVNMKTSIRLLAFCNYDTENVLIISRNI